MALPFRYSHNYNVYVQCMRTVYVQPTLSNRASSPFAATQTANLFHTDQMLVHTAQMVWQRLQHCREVTIVAIGFLWTEKIDWKEKKRILPALNLQSKIRFNTIHKQSEQVLAGVCCAGKWTARYYYPLETGHIRRKVPSDIRHFKHNAFHIRPRCRRNSDLLLIPYHTIQDDPQKYAASAQMPKVVL